MRPKQQRRLVAPVMVLGLHGLVSFCVPQYLEMSKMLLNFRYGPDPGSPVAGTPTNQTRGDLVVSGKWRIGRFVYILAGAWSAA